MHNSTTRHPAHRAAAVLAVALVVVVARLILGPWPTAIAVAAAGLWWGLWAWSRFETRTRPAKARAPELVQAARPVAGGHVGVRPGLGGGGGRVPGGVRAGGGPAMSVAEDRGAEWAPAPGSVARHNWPLPARCVWWLAHRPSLVALAALAVVVGVELGPLVLAAAVTVVAVVLAGWWRAHPRSFYPYGGRALLGLWRSLWAYGVRWRTAMMLSGLGGRFGGDEYVPRVVRVRAGRYVDRVTVRMVAGQSTADWGRRADALAHAFGARAVQVHELRRRPGYIRCSSAASTPSPRSSPCPHPAPSTSPRCRSAAARTARPGPCASAGSHTLVAGATGAGKGSVIWSLIRALGPLIRDGLVRLWVLDPKGGMELAAGAPLFDRFVYDDPAAMADRPPRRRGGHAGPGRPAAGPHPPPRPHRR